VASDKAANGVLAGPEYHTVDYNHFEMLLADPSGIPSFLGMGEVDPDVWHLKYRSTEAAM